jgi:hypothetical protein
MFQPFRVRLEAALDEAQAEKFEERGFSRTGQANQDQPPMPRERFQCRHLVRRMLTVSLWF